MKTYGKYKIISYNLSSQYKKALASSPEGLKAKFNELYGQSGVKTMTLLYSADQIANATDILAAAAMQNGRGITRLETDNLGHNYKVTTISLTEQLTKNVYVASEEELRALFYAQSGKSTKITFTCLPANFDAFSSAITDLANATGRSFGSSFTYSTYYSEYSIEFND